MTCRKSIIDHLTGGNTLEFGSDKCRAFSRFYVKKLNDFINVIVELNAQSFSYVGGRCHGFVV
jgi:hypothetical protein